MKVLFIGAHCDDIELGCGATIHKHRNHLDIYCAVLSQNTIWEPPVELGAICRKSLNSLGRQNLALYNEAPTEFYKSRQKIWDILQETKELINPDIVFTHQADTNQDHVTVFEETVRVFKTESIYCYIPNPVGTLQSRVNHLECVSKDDVKAKLKSAKRYRKVMGYKPYLDKKIIKSSMRHYGSNTKSEYAEAFIIHQQIQNGCLNT
jgi:N-acetylglucosamine malate deacetylase 1